MATLKQSLRLQGALEAMDTAQRALSSAAFQVFDTSLFSAWEDSLRIQDNFPHSGISQILLGVGEAFAQQTHWGTAGLSSAAAGLADSLPMGNFLAQENLAQVLQGIEPALEWQRNWEINHPISGMERALRSANSAFSAAKDIGGLQQALEEASRVSRLWGQDLPGIFDAAAAAGGLLRALEPAWWEQNALQVEAVGQAFSGYAQRRWGMFDGAWEDDVPQPVENMEYEAIFTHCCELLTDPFHLNERAADFVKNLFYANPVLAALVFVLMVNPILPKILFQTVPKKLGESICRYESVKLLGELDAMGGGSYRTFEAVDPATGKSYPIAVGPKGEAAILDQPSGEDAPKTPTLQEPLRSEEQG